MRLMPPLATFALLTIAILLLAMLEAVAAARLLLAYETRLAIGATIGGLAVFGLYRSPGS